MRSIENIRELQENIETMDRYIDSKREPEYDYALDLVKRGICFVVVKKADSYRFYPSRFIGYYKNTRIKHESNAERDGRETNSALNEILGHSSVHDPSLDKLYREYCESLGFIAPEKGNRGNERKFWKVLCW